MRTYIRPDINPDKYNAYSASAHLYAAIRTTEQADSKNTQGGIIVFPEKTKSLHLLTNTSAHWITGAFLKGRYTDRNGTVYSEDSLSIEIIGVSDYVLTEIGEELCRAYNLKSVLVKYYSERNLICIVNGE